MCSEEQVFRKTGAERDRGIGGQVDRWTEGQEDRWTEGQMVCVCCLQLVRTTELGYIPNPNNTTGLRS